MRINIWFIVCFVAAGLIAGGAVYILGSPPLLDPWINGFYVQEVPLPNGGSVTCVAFYTHAISCNW